MFNCSTVQLFNCDDVGQMGYYYGLSEIMVFGKPRHAPPMLAVKQMFQSDNIKLTWTAPGSDTVVILRKKWKDEGIKSRFSQSRHDGIVVLKSGKVSGEYIDKDVEKGARYNYTAWARSANLGWNLLSYDSCEMAVSGTPNFNLAQDKMVRANTGNHQGTYGTADAVVSGDRSHVFGITDGQNTGDGLRVDIDLKRVVRCDLLSSYKLYEHQEEGICWGAAPHPRIREGARTLSPPSAFTRVGGHNLMLT